jgi:hypothetical protein
MPEGNEGPGVQATSAAGQCVLGLAAHADPNKLLPLPLLLLLALLLLLLFMLFPQLTGLPLVLSVALYVMALAPRPSTSSTVYLLFTTVPAATGPAARIQHNCQHVLLSRGTHADTCALGNVLATSVASVIETAV